MDGSQRSVSGADSSERSYNKKIMLEKELRQNSKEKVLSSDSERSARMETKNAALHSSSKKRYKELVEANHEKNN